MKLSFEDTRYRYTLYLVPGTYLEARVRTVLRIRSHEFENCFFIPARRERYDTGMIHAPHASLPRACQLRNMYQVLSATKPRGNRCQALCWCCSLESGLVVPVTAVYILNHTGAPGR